MIKKSILLAAGALMATGAFAATLSPQEALQRVSTTPEGKKMAKSSVQPSLTFTAVDKRGEATMYVFNKADNGGFMLLSADDIAFPMLGYTDAGAFDPANIPAEMQYWMDEYSRQIEFARARGVKASARRNYPAEWEYVAPLCKTQWDQGEPYNNDCPTSIGIHLPTGCVATAMAQIMKYHNYPEMGRGSINYSCMTLGQTLSMSFDQQPFEWNKMLNSYTKGNYSEEEGQAVSYLMKACGYASQMQYASGASGTSSQQAGVGMVTYFNYDKNIKCSERMEFTDSEWAELVYNQIKNVGPALYSGQADAGGHAFVVDGYDGNGYFHINWGWSGMCNGFYLLTALNPTEQGTGGYMGGYNFDQSLLYDIKRPANPDDNQPSFNGYLSIHGTVNATMSGSQMSFTLKEWTVKTNNGVFPGCYANTSLNAVSCDFGIEIVNADGSGTPVYVKSITRAIPIGSFYTSPNLTPTAKFDELLPNGRYKVSLVYCKANTWYHFRHPVGMYDYVYVTKEGTKYTVENLSPASLEISNARITTPLYYSSPCQVEITFSNPSDQEILQVVVPTLSVNGVVNYEGDLQMISLAPGEQATKSLTYTFNRVNNGQVPSSAKPVEFTLGVSDTNRNINFGTFGTYQMYRASGSPRVSVDHYTITNAMEETQKDYGMLYGIENYSYIMTELAFNVSGTNAFLASPITASVYEFDPETLAIGNLVFEKNYKDYAYYKSGQSGTMHTALNVSDYCTPAKTYVVKTYYLDGGNRKEIGTLYFAADSGVDGIISDGGKLNLIYSGNTVKASSERGMSSITVFDVKGAQVASTSGDSLDISALAGGIYIIRATDKAGESKIVKIVK